MDKKIFEEEQAHLSEVYDKLEERQASLGQEIEELNATASDEKNDIRDNLRFDTADDEVKTEMYGEIETWNRYIDSYNVKSAVLSDNLKKVRMLLEAPYFARVTLQFEPDEEPESYYIGRAALAADNGIDQMIVDWRSPIAETYYNQDNGRTFYMVNDRRIDVDLKLRRQFDLNRDRLNAYFDTSVAIEDPMLLESLSKQRTDRMQAITVTIQKEQNAVIRYPDVPVLLVNGIAGSGKTSVLLQRIAYLFYHHRKTLRPGDVYLLTLNPVFQQYISGVLPDLGEQNPNTMTWQELMNGLHVPGGAAEDAPAENLRRIDAALPKYRLTAEDINPISQKGRCVLQRNTILDILAQYDGRIETGVRLTHVAEEELLERAKASLRRRRSSAEEDEAVEDRRRGAGRSAGWSGGADGLMEEDAAWTEQQEDESSGAGRRGGRTEDDRDLEDGPERGRKGASRRKSWGTSAESLRADGMEEADGDGEFDPEGGLDSESGRQGSSARRLAETAGDGRLSIAEENEIVNNYGGAFKMIREFGWLNYEHIGEQILGKKHLTSIEWLYVRMALTGECDRMAQYVMIDEVQDYTEAQLMTLAKYFPNARFMLLGDEFQSIREGTVSFQRIHEIFAGRGKETAELPLQTSYRSSPEITALFAGLLPEDQKLQARSVQRPGLAPVIRECRNHAEYAALLREAIAQAGNKNGLTAVICQNRRSLRRVRELLGESAPPLIRGDEKLPTQGVFLIELQYAKGLEFDEVILPDADERTCPVSEEKRLLTRHRLYTAISRATKKITILSDGKLTPLLPGTAGSAAPGSDRRDAG